MRVRLCLRLCLLSAIDGAARAVVRPLTTKSREKAWEAAGVLKDPKTAERASNHALVTMMERAKASSQ
ncbi:hypothetical protein VKT23_019767 [Stygiomarasmius scandens]|uniref:Uncharacterized protein n=1 Tax=Marasmiellus scandens TaxID=2682957 RepID=A0ABR1IPD5_9AGAR